jgi:hypothetical protein
MTRLMMAEYHACIDCLFCIEVGLLGVRGKIVEDAVNKILETQHLSCKGDLGFCKHSCDICKDEQHGERYMIIGLPV